MYFLDLLTFSSCLLFHILHSETCFQRSIPPKFSSFRVNTALLEFQFSLLWRIAESGKLHGPIYLWEKSENYWKSRTQLCCCKEQYDIYISAATGQVGECWTRKGRLYSIIVISFVTSKPFVSLLRIWVQSRMAPVLLAPSSCLSFISLSPLHPSVYPSMLSHMQPLPAGCTSPEVTDIRCSRWLQLCRSLDMHFHLQ